MSKTPLKTRLYSKIKETGSLTFGDMCTFVNSIPMKISTGERKLRDLEIEGKIVNVWDKTPEGKPYICGYKLPSDYVEPVKQTYQIVNDQNGRPVVKKL